MRRMLLKKVLAIFGKGWRRTKPAMLLYVISPADTDRRVYLVYGMDYEID